MLQGAFAPPYCPAFPAQRLGSISLCGGARSNCAHPQNMSLGKNILGWDAAFCALPKAEIDKRNASIHTNVFIQPPEFCFPLTKSPMATAHVVATPIEILTDL